MVAVVVVVWLCPDPETLLVGESRAKAPRGSFSVTGTPVSFIEATEATLCTEDGGERFWREKSDKKLLRKVVRSNNQNKRDSFSAQTSVLNILLREASAQKGHG